MFKLEINVNGVIHHRHWRNKHSDDFLQFMPKFFSKEFGEIIRPEDIAAYLISELEGDILDGKDNQSELNGIYYINGKILIKRIQKALYKVGDKIRLEDYEKERLDRDDKFKDSKEKDKVKTKAPKSKKEDFISGKDDQGNDIIEANIDVVTVEATDDLAMDAESLEMELIGQKLKQWPYKENLSKDKNGKLKFPNGIEFLGNK